MKLKLSSATMAAIIILGGMAGCGGKQAMALINTTTFNPADFQSIRLDYDADAITVLESDNSDVVLKEYMNENKKAYYARTSVKNGELFITEGDRPRSSGFESYVELYIPQGYTDSLSLHSTSGKILSQIALNLTGGFAADTTSGTLELSNVAASNVKVSSTNGGISLAGIEADAISIQTTNAATTMNQTAGVITYQSTGGALTASGLTGSGTFNASGDGSIDISFADVTGNIIAYCKNGILTATLPNELDFEFSAITKEGTIETNFDDLLAVTESSAAGLVGDAPSASVKLETRNGDIKASR